MQNNSAEASDIESVTVQLAGLEITLTARRTGETTSVAASAAEEAPEEQPAH